MATVSTEREAPQDSTSCSYSVASIEEGTVLDHIPAGAAIRILSLLSLEKYTQRITVGINLPSRCLQKKDIIKIEGKKLSLKEIDLVALFASKASINVIKGHQVIEKYTVDLPSTIEGFFFCPNKRCITNHEDAGRQFQVLPRKGLLLLQCKFCEQVFNFHDHDQKC